MLAFVHADTFLPPFTGDVRPKAGKGGTIARAPIAPSGHFPRKRGQKDSERALSVFANTLVHASQRQN
jgi:hypothetical protein